MLRVGDCGPEAAPQPLPAALDRERAGEGGIRLQFDLREIIIMVTVYLRNIINEKSQKERGT